MKKLESIKLAKFQNFDKHKILNIGRVIGGDPETSRPTEKTVSTFLGLDSEKVSDTKPDWSPRSYNSSKSNTSAIFYREGDLLVLPAATDSLGE